MKKILILTLFLATMVVVSACAIRPAVQPVNQNQNVNAATSTSEIDTSEWKTYRNEEYGFEFRYPKDANLVWYQATIEDQKPVLSGFFSTTKEADPFRGGEVNIEVYDRRDSRKGKGFESRFELEKFNNCFYEKEYQYHEKDYYLVIGCVPIKFDIENFMKIYNQLIATINFL